MIRPQALMERIGAETPREAVFQVFDPLIGAYDRSHLPAVIAALTKAHTSEADTACLMIALDGADEIDESYGVPGIASAVRELADIVHEAGGEDALLLRYGRTVLCLMVPGSGVTNALAIAERVRHQLAVARIPVKGRTMAVTCSIGVATTTDVMDIASFVLLDTAERAMKDAARRRNAITMSAVSMAA